MFCFRLDCDHTVASLHWYTGETSGAQLYYKDTLVELCEQNIEYRVLLFIIIQNVKLKHVKLNIFLL